MFGGFRTSYEIEAVWQGRKIKFKQLHVLINFVSRVILFVTPATTQELPVQQVGGTEPLISTSAIHAGRLSLAHPLLWRVCASQSVCIHAY